MSEQTPVAEIADSGDGALLEDPSFERLLNFLRDSRSFDFTGYKRPSLMRRVRHRMGEIGIESFDDYQDVLQLEPREFTALFNTILINVTSFFRDSDAWEHLHTDILPQVLESSNGGGLRVWSAGCSAGQEAYTIAMLLHEEMGSSFRERVKIYATDIDEDALNYGRQASYTERETRGLPDAYRNRYFDFVNGRYIFTPDLRRSVIFGRNDLTSDAPISRIDILLCRNTLMYLNAETQSRVISRLGFALRQNGVLFLGKAEMLLNHASVFDPIDLKRRFFRRVRTDIAEGAGFGAVDTPQPLRRALAFIDDHAAEPITLSDIAVASRLSPRGLQAAFRRHLDTTPLAYLRSVRMERAHHDLQSAGPGEGVSVATLAAKWGFTHLGRFAIEYRRRFRVHPSHTLRG
jgi:two-component system CheB/CheR fusion protein